MYVDSDEEEPVHKVSNKQAKFKKSFSSYQHQISDTGQDTDVSQLSEDGPGLVSKVNNFFYYLFWLLIIHVVHNVVLLKKT